MNYRDGFDRKISTYGALLTITIIGSIATLFIVHTINNIDFRYESEFAALNSN
jgi:hypothetical protein